MSGPTAVREPTRSAKLFERRRDSRDAIFLGVLVGVSLWLRLLYLGSKSLWLDEVSSATFIRLDWSSFFRLLWAREGNMVFYYLLLRAWTHLGHSESTLRLLSVIFGVATIPAIYLLARHFFGRRCGLYAALLLAVSGAHVRASQWMRSYSLLLFLVVLSSLFLARALEKPTRRLWLLYVLVTCLGVYSHFMVGLLILAQWASLAFLNPQQVPRKQLLAAMAGVGVLSLPAAFYVLTRNVGQLNWVSNPRPIELYHLAVFLAAGGGKVLGALLLFIDVMLILVALRGFGNVWKSSPRSLLAWRYVFLFTCLLTPALLAFSLSFWKPIFFYRYLIISLPALIVLVGRGLDLIPVPLSPLVALIAVGLSLGAVSKTYAPEEDWQGACQYLLSQAQSGDAVLFNGHGRMPLEYYQQRAFGTGGPKLKFPGYPPSGRDGSVYAYFYPRVWFVHFPDFVADSSTGRIESSLDTLYTVRIVRHFKAVTVLLYENPRISN